MFIQFLNQIDPFFCQTPAKPIFSHALFVKFSKVCNNSNNLRNLKSYKKNVIYKKLELLNDDSIYNDVLIWKISQQTELNFDRNFKKMLAMTASIYRLKSEATVHM